MLISIASISLLFACVYHDVNEMFLSQFPYPNVNLQSFYFSAVCACVPCHK